MVCLFYISINCDVFNMNDLLSASPVSLSSGVLNL